MGRNDFESMLLEESDNETALRQLKEKYQDILERDALTGILNRRGFYTHTYNLLSDNAGTDYVICCINIDKFKVVNDLFGTFAGDKLLNFLARHLREYVGEKGTLARLNADNFAVCIPYEDGIYEDITATIKLWLADYPLTLHIFTHCGFYRISDITIPVSIMCDRANMAIMEIKGNYEVRYFVYDDKIRKRILQEQEILNEMKAALDSGQFTVYYQPKVNMESGKVIGSEALVRWIHPEKNFISPGVFIPIFEKNGFISALDQYVWETVCRDLRSWMQQGYTVVPVSINVSRAELYDRGLALLLSSLIDKYEIPIELLQLEITESAYTENPEQLIGTVEELKEMGFTILMDDFGSGYSSLNTLKDVPVDVLKLDLKFLYNMDKNLKANYILKSVVQMAKRLNLHVIAEGVETENQAEFLKSIGCVRAQGYLYAKPMPKEDYEKYLEDSSKVSRHDDDTKEGLVNIDDVLSSFHRDDEIDWYRGAMFHLKAQLFEYDIENDIMTIFDMKSEEGNGELNKLEIPHTINVFRNTDLIFEADRASVVETFEKIRSLDLLDCEVRIKDLMYDKGYRWYKLQGMVRYTSEGLPSVVTGVIKDVSEEKSESAVHSIMTLFERNKSEQEVIKKTLQNIAKEYCANTAGIVFPVCKKSHNIGGVIWDDQLGFVACEDNDMTRRIDEYIKLYKPNEEGITLLQLEDAKRMPEDVGRFLFANGVESLVFERCNLNEDYVITVLLGFKYYKTMTPDSFKRTAEAFRCINASVLGLITEKERIENTELYTRAFEMSAFNLWEWNIQTGLMHRSVNFKDRDDMGEWIENVPESMLEYIHPDFREECLHVHNELREGRDATLMVKRLYKDGQYHWLRIAFVVCFDSNGIPDKAVGFGENVDQMYADQMQTRERIKKSADIVEGLESWFKVDLTDDVIIDRSSKLSRIKDREAYQETIDVMARRVVFEDDAEEFREKASREHLIERLKEGKCVETFGYRYYDAASPDKVHYRLVSIDLTVGKDGHIYAFAFLKRVDSMLICEKCFEAGDEIDKELVIFNKSAFEHISKYLIGHSSDSPKGGMFVIDMDKFLMIMNNFGEEYSKEIIVNVLSVIRAFVPNDAIISRVLNDRFAVYVPTINSAHDMYRLSALLQKSLYNSFVVGNTSYVLSASIGVAMLSDYDNDFDAAAIAAYNELKQAKQLGS